MSWGTVLWTGVNIFSTVSDYHQRRQQGDNILKAGAISLLNYRLWMHPAMMVGAFGGPLAQMASARAGYNIHSVRQATTPFAPVPNRADQDELGRSRSALLQSAMATNNTLSLSGHSFAGMEASAAHYQWGR